MEHTATPWHACGSGILSGGDAIQQMVIAVVYYAEMPAPAMMAEREANKQFIITACNAHDQLVAEIAALVAENEALHEKLSRKDEAFNTTVNAALTAPDPVREQLVMALKYACRMLKPGSDFAYLDVALTAAGVTP
jgi:transcriptional regulator with GAF, ATPase, and Fis domain